MKKIGVLTYWGVANYGAWTQAYALNKVLSNMYPEYRIEHLNYLEQSHWDLYYKNDNKLLNNYKYNWDIIPNSGALYKESVNNYSCDVLIIGADSVWEESFTGAVSTDWHFLGHGFNSIGKIITYAPSSGIYTGEDSIPDMMKKGMEKISHISVRDETTFNLVEKVIGKKATITLDPALLWDFEKDENIKNPTYEKYAVVYGVTWDKSFIENVKKYAKEKGLLLISVGYVNEWCDVSFKMIELRALEWIGFFKFAECVITSTFHGLMVGLNFRKQIKFFQADYVKNRSKTLCEKLNIPNHMKNFHEHINYNEVIEVLERNKDKSLSWLEEAIKEG